MLSVLVGLLVLGIAVCVVVVWLTDGFIERSGRCSICGHKPDRILLRCHGCGRSLCVSCANDCSDCFKSYCNECIQYGCDCKASEAEAVCDCCKSFKKDCACTCPECGSIVCKAEMYKCPECDKSVCPTCGVGCEGGILCRDCASKELAEITKE